MRLVENAHANISTSTTNKGRQRKIENEKEKEMSVNNKYGQDMKNVLENLDLEGEQMQHEVNSNNIIMNTNIFKSTITSMPKLNTILKETPSVYNHFNANILSNQNWGCNSPLQKFYRSKTRQIYKPSRKELEKEHGMNLLRTRLPRQRRVQQLR